MFTEAPQKQNIKSWF